MNVNTEVNYQSNPLHGLRLKKLITELVDHYGFEILFAYLNINCFKTRATIDSSVKFLKKTDWAREKVEVFYLYKFKNLPKVSSEQYSIPPRDRIIPEGQVPREPAKLSLEDAERQREKIAKKSADRSHSRPKDRSGYSSRKRQPAKNTPLSKDDDPWGNWRSKSDE